MQVFFQSKIKGMKGHKDVELSHRITQCILSVMRLYLFVWPKSLLIVNYIIKSLYSMVNVKLEYFHCITYDSIFVV